MIPIKNIYYMLSYAFCVLRGQGFRSLATEKYENTAELCAAILCKGVSEQLKQGLGRTYIPQTEALSSLRGKIELAESLKTKSLLKRQLICSYDDFSVNTPMNRIIKSTMLTLLKHVVRRELKQDMRKLLVFFGEVDEIDLNSAYRIAQQNPLYMRYDRNNQTYRMLMAVCWLVIKGLLQRQEDGTLRMMEFLDEQKPWRLYEKFILNYYRREHKDIRAEASQIKWQLDGESDSMLLPAMQTDITLSSKDGRRVLIIDAKHYDQTTQEHRGTHMLRPDHLYQIFTYVKNKEHELSGTEHKVAGMLLYAKTDEDIVPRCEYSMSGNTVYARTLDLNQDFEHIKGQLDQIYYEFFQD